jgi:hypothetical protein
MDWLKGSARRAPKWSRAWPAPSRLTIRELAAMRLGDRDPAFVPLMLAGGRAGKPID